MRAAAVVGATALAIALQTTLAQFVVRGTVAVDLVLVVVVYAALASGPVTGILTGAFAGLIQDALSSGIVGIGGMAKTVVGFAGGIVGTQFIVAQAVPRFVVFFGATVLHAVITITLYELLNLAEFGRPVAAVAGQALGNALIGVVAFRLVELVPGALERRRSFRTPLRR